MKEFIAFKHIQNTKRNTSKVIPLFSKSGDSEIVSKLFIKKTGTRYTSDMDVLRSDMTAKGFCDDVGYDRFKIKKHHINTYILIEKDFSFTTYNDFRYKAHYDYWMAIALVCERDLKIKQILK